MRCLKIKADVHRVVDDPVRPVVIWIHGGALIMGNREGIAAPVKKWAADKGYVLVSIDYRLAPETQLPEIIRRCRGCFRVDPPGWSTAVSRRPG